MWFKLAVVALMLALSGATALDFHESINTNGDGAIYSKTNGKGTQDLAQGIGNIEYVRALSIDDGISLLSSKYRLNNAKETSYKSYGSFSIDGVGSSGWVPAMPGYTPNRYLIGMKGQNQIAHVVSVYGTSDISSDSSVNYINQQVNTDYNIVASGTLEEIVLDGSSGKRPLPLAETWLSGNGFTLSSGLTDRYQMGSDVSVLIDLLNETKMVGEKSVQEPPTPLKGMTANIVIGVPAGDSEEGPIEESEESTSDFEETSIVFGEINNTCDLATGSGCNGARILAADSERLRIQSDDSAAFAFGNATNPNQSGWKVIIDGNRKILLNTACNNPGVACEDFTHIAARRPGISEQLGGLGQLQGVSPTTTIIGVIRKPILT